MFRNMVTSLFKHEKIRTTTPKAKALRTVADKMVTLGKKAYALESDEGQESVARRLHYRRQALRVIREKEVVSKLFDEIAPRYSDRPGGYTRVLRLGRRIGDDADMAIIELVEEKMPDRKGKGGKRKKGAAKSKAKKAAGSKPKPKDKAEKAAKDKTKDEAPEKKAAEPEEPAEQASEEPEAETAEESADSKDTEEPTEG